MISNDDTFEQLILAKTNNKGVRFVLNSLNDDKISANVNSLNVNGHFIQTKKIDVNKGHAISKLTHFLVIITIFIMIKAKYTTNEQDYNFLSLL